MTKVTRCSCWHKNFVPKGLSAPPGIVSPCLGLYACIKYGKNCIKSDFKEIFLKLLANDQKDKRFLFTSKFYPLGLTTPDLWLYTFIKHLLNHEKLCIKSEVEEILFKCNKWPLWWGLPDDIKILAQMGCLPLPMGYVKLLFFNNSWF